MEFLRNNFESHVFSFMDEMQLIPPSRRGIVAVSGGIDSMCLLAILAKNKQIKLEALHINHGTRKENDFEEKLVLGFCEKLNIKCHVIRLQMSLQEGDFENRARIERHKIFLTFLRDGQFVYTAHHLDDSFEWSLMQSLKQSSLKSTLGIPVYNGGICRPFLCVSKKQIYHYAKETKLEWSEDKSNQNTKFERNALRGLLSQFLKERYKGHLRHYVNRQNQLAHLLKKHRLLTRSRLTIKPQGPYGIELISTDFRFHKEKIREYIHYFSEKKRGEIEKELEKLIECHRNNKKIKMHGPFSFSGGVKAYLLKDSLFLCHQTHLDYYKKLDAFLSTNLSQIHSDVFPHIVLLDSDKSKSISKLIHPLLPLTTQSLKNNKVAYSFLPLL